MRQVSYTSYDYKPMETVPVIASFDRDGHICPLYVRLGGNPCKVLRWHLRSSFGNVSQYVCTVADFGRERPVVISYHYSEGVWAVETGLE